MASPESTEKECNIKVYEISNIQEKKKENDKSLKSTIEQKYNIWKNKYDKLIQEMDKKYNLTSESFEKSFQEVASKYKIDFRDVCEDNQRMIIECYKTNKNSPLQCQQMVKEFSHCVNETSKTTVKNNQNKEGIKKI
uniref:MICOS complex subunit MIC19 n=1 Tax=Clastoptera arizonana TaxID=38151 RepID=A0A1B6CBG5_9HEMI